MIWQNNFSLNSKGRVWIAWRPNVYSVETKQTHEQFIDCKVTELGSLEQLYLTLVYGLNREQQRRDLWSELATIAQSMTNAWCLLRDFNTILYKEDRIGGVRLMTTI